MATFTRDRAEAIEAFLKVLRERLLKADHFSVEWTAGVTRIEDPRETYASHEPNGSATCKIEINDGAADDLKTCGPFAGWSENGVVFGRGHE